jgi:response regulator RpfG family c-di-GMP phosphodiesterase
MSGPMITMLTIDDRSITTDLDRAGYRSMGVMVRTVTTFQEAMETIKKKQIDIIVINHDFAKVNSAVTCEVLKKQDSTKHIPVVITSVQTNAETRNKSLKAGADLFVEQPIPRQYFIEKLKKLLEQKTRGHERVSVQVEVEVRLNGKITNYEVGDLSTSGVLLTTEEKIPTGTRLEISFELPTYKKPIKATGEAVRIIARDLNNSDKAYGVGVKFVEFEGDSQSRLEKFVNKTADESNRMIYYL